MARRQVYVPPPIIPRQAFRLQPSSYLLKFSASMSQLSPLGAGNVVEFRIRNPLNSGFVALVTKVTAWANATRRTIGFTSGSVQVDFATTVTPTSRRRPPETATCRASTINSNASIVNPVLVFDRLVEANTPFITPDYLPDDYLVSFEPGHLFEVAFNDAGNLTTDIYTCDIDWTEMPIRLARQ